MLSTVLSSYHQDMVTATKDIQRQGPIYMVGISPKGIQKGWEITERFKGLILKSTYW